MFTHLYQRDHFSEDEVRIYVGEIVLALEHLHKVRRSGSCSHYLLYLAVREKQHVTKASSRHERDKFHSAAIDRCQD